MFSSMTVPSTIEIDGLLHICTVNPPNNSTKITTAKNISAVASPGTESPDPKRQKINHIPDSTLCRRLFKGDSHVEGQRRRPDNRQAKFRA
jgi:hypothetical protein